MDSQDEIPQYLASDNEDVEQPHHSISPDTREVEHQHPKSPSETGELEEEPPLSPSEHNYQEAPQSPSDAGDVEQAETPQRISSDHDDSQPPRHISSDNEDNNQVQRRISSDDENVEQETPHSPANDEDEAQQHSDGEQPELSDSEGEDDGQKKDVGKLISNIFGDESDNEAEGGEDNDVRAALQESEEEEKDWDFDRIIAEKKKERSKKRKRRRDGSIDLCSNADGQIRHVVELMKNAAAEDREANNQRKPAIQKTKLLEVVKSTLLRADFFEALCENDMMSAISEWLAPLPDKSLPSLEIRTTLLKILDGFPNLEPGLLKQSGLGKAIMLIFKHPKESKENKMLASKLVRNWSQPIFQISADYAAMTRDEREKMDMDHLPEVKRRRYQEKMYQPSQSKESSNNEEQILGPGDKGFIGRARVPRSSTSAYIIRPKPNVESQFRGESKNFTNSRFDKTTREFKERNKTSKAQRAVGVSIEGRRMEI